MNTSKSDIKALFFDIDGTLVSFKTHEVPQSTVQALRQAKAAGVKVYISTGRPQAIITNLAPINDLIDGYVTMNGAYCYVGDKVVVSQPIAKDEVDAVMRYVKRHGYACFVVGRDDIAIYNPTPEVKRIFVDELNVQNLDFAKPVEPLLEKPVYQLTAFFDLEHERELAPQAPGCAFGRWHPGFVDINSRLANKGEGLKAMAKFTGCTVPQTMAFGDGGNDIPILRTAGIGVAMGNAAANVKSAASYVTTSVDDDGIMNALRHFAVIP